MAPYARRNISDKELQPGQLKAIEALLTSRSMDEAAAKAQVSRRLLYKWKEEAAFANALRLAERYAIEDIGRSLLSLGNLAASALYDALQPEQKICHRIAAAQIFYDKVLALREHNDLEKRIAELESRLENGQQLFEVSIDQIREID